LISGNKEFRDVISFLLIRDDHQVEIITSQEEFKSRERIQADITIIDYDDMTILTKLTFMKDNLRRLSPSRVIITGSKFLGFRFIEEDMKEGACDCIKKPSRVDGKFTPETIEKVYQRLSNSIENALVDRSKEMKLSHFKRDDIKGDSLEIKLCLSDLAQAAATDKPIFITGETGSGKELFAKAAHDNSKRSESGNMIMFNCATIPETMAESIIFGHVKGAFTDAYADQTGLVELAHKGTLFLDEIGDLSLSNQKRLLRCVDEKKVRPMGGNKLKDADFRLISATNRDINTMREMGTFRDDLYYRISTFVINVPPLRKRRGDIPEIAEHHIKTICKERDIEPAKEWTESFMEALTVNDWPGNVRQLMNQLEQAVSRSLDNPILDIYHLSSDIRGSWVALDVIRDNLLPGDSKSSAESIAPTVNLKLVPGHIPPLDHVEREYFVPLLDMVDKGLLTAAQARGLSGLKKDAYYRLIKKHGLKTKKED
jgi:two-component system NtrC family response regulator